MAGNLERAQERRRRSRPRGSAARAGSGQKCRADPGRPCRHADGDRSRRVRGLAAAAGDRNGRVEGLAVRPEEDIRVRTEPRLALCKSWPEVLMFRLLRRSVGGF